MNENKTNINWYPGHMAKTKREISEKLELIDIVYEVIDARMPRSSRIVDLDEIIKNKPRIIIATKYDLCDKNVTDKILSEYNDIVIKCNLKENSNILKEIVSKTESLIKNINDKRVEKGLSKRSYRALVIGVPNAGKSTLINRLAGKNITKTGNVAGVTKNLSWIRLNKDLELLDTPGILWPKIENREQALKLLKARINDARMQEFEKEQGSMRKSKIGTGDRSEKIRTYNYPQNRVTDHRINFSIMELNKVMEGYLEPIIEALITEDQRLKLEGSGLNE